MKGHEWIAIMVLITLAAWIAMVQFAPKAYAATGDGAELGIAGGANSGGQVAGSAGAQATGGAGSQANGANAGGSAVGGTGETVTIPIKVVNGYYEPREIRVKQGTKVRLELDRASFVGCMVVFNIWGYGVQQNIRNSNVVEFVADKVGTFRTSCSMGMGDGRFIVEPADGAVANAQGVAQEQGTAQQAEASPAILAGPSGTCGMGGGCGCGG